MSRDGGVPRFSKRVARFCIRHRTGVLLALGAVTAVLGVSASRLEIRTVFSDLLPQGHPYVQVHEEYKEGFGGSNLVSIVLETDEGDVFQPKVLDRIADLTRDLREVTGVNQFQIVSLASRKLKTVHASTYGIESRPLMWPDVPRTRAELEALRQAVVTNPLVYGSYVSVDLKSALVTVDFIDRLLDYDAAYAEITSLAEKYTGDGVTVSVIGDPILRGLIKHYVPETLGVFAITLAVLGLFLFVVFTRSWRGTLIPLVSAAVTGTWALGITNLLGFNYDPLTIVIAFLITARVISHSVQAITRFEEFAEEGAGSAEAAAEASLAELWKPGILSVVTDAGGIAVVALAPIPLLQKTATIGALWVLCIAATGVVLTPVLLSWIRDPRRYAHSLDLGPAIRGSLDFFAGLATSRPRRLGLLAGAALLFVASAALSSRLTIGDAEPGTPLLWPDAPYNRTVEKVNSGFLGTDQMFVVVAGDRQDALQRPELLRNMNRFQRYMERQPEIGGSVSLADLIPSVNRMVNEGNPRYEELAPDALSNGELLYLYLSGSDPGDLDRFTDVQYQNGAVTLYFRDHRGSTIREAIDRIQRFRAADPPDGAHYELAGGMVGVRAAVNQVILSGQVESIALALLVVLLTCSLTYRSGIAGLTFMVPVLLSNAVTFAYMATRGIGLNVNTLPVAALGIGLGVDYSIYVVDAIREKFSEGSDLGRAVHHAMRTAGRGVVVTATPLIACTALWYVLSPLRFQAEMAILIALWMGVSAASALLVMPSLIYALRPRFVTGGGTGGTPSPDGREVVA